MKKKKHNNNSMVASYIKLVQAGAKTKAADTVVYLLVVIVGYGIIM